MHESTEDEELASLTLAQFSERCPIAARELMRAVIPSLSTVLEKQPDTPDKWGAAFAVGASFCFGVSMSEKAAQLGCSRALISYKATEICKALGWPPSAYMKSEDAAETARQARNRVVGRGGDIESLIEETRKRGIIK
jgi:hypothetical protein